MVFGQNLPKQVNLLRAQLQELEDVLHAGVHGELGAPLRRLQLAGVPHDFRRWLQRQIPTTRIDLWGTDNPADKGAPSPGA